MCDYVITSLASGNGFGGGSRAPLPPFSEGNFDFNWVFKALEYIMSVFGTIFDFISSPIYTWLDDVFESVGFLDAYVDSVINNVKGYAFFQQTFFDLLFTLLPLVIVITLLLFVISALK